MNDLNGWFCLLDSLVRLEQRAHNTVLALDDLRRVTRARRRSSIYNDAQVMRANEELLNPPGPLNAAIFRFLLQVSHTMDNMVEELIAEVGARRRWRLELILSCLHSVVPAHCISSEASVRWLMCNINLSVSVHCMTSD